MKLLNRERRFVVWRTTDIGPCGGSPLLATVPRKRTYLLNEPAVPDAGLNKSSPLAQAHFRCRHARLRPCLIDHGAMVPGNTAFEQGPVLAQSVFIQKSIHYKIHQNADTSRQLSAGKIDELHRGAELVLAGQDLYQRAYSPSCLICC
jgi:hypothetical protein